MEFPKQLPEQLYSSHISYCCHCQPPAAGYASRNTLFLPAHLTTQTRTQNYALLHTRLADINKQSGDNSRPFPKPSLAHKAASLLYPTEADLLDYTARAEAFGDHRIWTHCSAPNVLLYPTTNGAGFGAVADVLNVEESPDSDGAITLTLDIVHEPKIVNELEGHPKQTMDERSHYHWLAPQGIDVDANKMLSLVSSSGGMLQGACASMCVQA